MNKTAIKNFAIWARNKLIADISYRAGLMGITTEGIQKALPQSTGTTEFYDIGMAEPYSIDGDAVKQRRSLVEKIRSKERESNYQTAYKYVIEEVAYTWFNRLIAVRFMEVNDYLPSHIRVLSSDSGKMEPDLVTTPFDAELSFSADEEQEIYRLKQENKVDEVFRILFVKQCDALNEILPALFEKTADYTEFLLSLSVIDQDGVVWHLVHDIPEEDFNVELGGQVEIIGWLYQYYNVEPFEQLYDGDKATEKVNKEEIGYATQLFTPDWIVRYMVENSVGRTWIEHMRAVDESKDEAALAAEFGWKYYLPEAKQEPEVEEKLRELRKERAALKPEQITMIDPCMGSGHILVYGFSVLMQIYESAGYGQRDAAKSILEHNLFGLDIDDRAYQMAYFAVMMKAREYNRRILNGENTCKVYAIQESNGITDAALGDMGGSLSEDERQKALKEIRALIAEFKDAKEYGSILNIEKRDWDLLRCFAVPNMGIGQLSLDMNATEPAANRLQEIIDIAEAMANKYLATVTNPPYLNANRMDSALTTFAAKNYKESKQDISTIMLQAVSNKNALQDGFISFIMPTSWMFSAKFKKIREIIIQKYQFESIVDCGTELFDGKIGHLYIGAWVLRKRSPHKKGIAIDLTEFCYSRRDEKQTEFFNLENRHIFNQQEFNLLPDAPVAYSVSEKTFEYFSSGDCLDNVGKARQGLTTSDNNTFLRNWYEVQFEKIGFGLKSVEQTQNTDVKWYPFIKGGDFQRWYQREDFVVNYQNDGADIKKSVMSKYSYLNNPGFVVKNTEWYFHEGITWNDVAGDRFNARFTPEGYIFADASPCFFGAPERVWSSLGYFNSVVFQHFADVICQGLHYSTGQIPKIPYLHLSDYDEATIASYAKDNYKLVSSEFEESESSWSFKANPIVKKARSRSHWGNDEDITIEYVFSYVAQDYDDRFNQLKENEERINKLFIDIYGLQNELESEVEDKAVTVRHADLQRDIKSLLSYAVGCMFGRYSLNYQGLAYAGGTWDASKYSTFLPDTDNVIPITDEEYLEDDIVFRLCTWLKVVFGESTLEANLDFIAKALGNKGDSSREVIRNYFLNDFFKDHCQTYSVTGSGKRPIYWLFDSGKQNGFKALIYLHRYNADTIGNLRIDYLHRMQRIYESEISRMQDMIDHSTSAREVAQSTKRREKLQKQLKECREYDERLAHLALSRIELDLDDGVKVNYRKIQTANDGKFYEVLADSKNIMTKK